MNNLQYSISSAGAICSAQASVTKAKLIFIVSLGVQHCSDSYVSNLVNVDECLGRFLILVQQGNVARCAVVWDFGGGGEERRNPAPNT